MRLDSTPIPLQLWFEWGYYPASLPHGRDTLITIMRLEVNINDYMLLLVGMSEIGGREVGVGVTNNDVWQRQGGV